MNGLTAIVHKFTMFVTKYYSVYSGLRRQTLSEYYCFFIHTLSISYLLRDIIYDYNKKSNM